MEMLMQRWTKAGLTTVIIGTAILSVGCMTNKHSEMSMIPADGDIAVPKNYQNWTKYVGTVDKKNGQIREIYINNVGLKANKGEAFPYGTIAVMEIYQSKTAEDGKPALDANGRMIKSDLSKIFVQQKEEGWGQNLKPGVPSNGEWVYAAYMADASTPATQDFSSCRGCHAPLANQDFMPRYDEHFNFKKQY